MYKYVCNLYHFLIKACPERGKVVVYGRKQVYMKAAFLACSFAGITYIPVDSDSTPAARVESILRQTRPALILGDAVPTADLKAQAVESGNVVVTKARLFSIMNRTEYEEIDRIYMREEDIYYIIFTSGSTGEPKGVQVTYSNIDSCIQWLRRVMDPREEVILNQASFSFDLSVADLYLSLLEGSSHYILEPKKDRNFAELFSRLAQSHITMAVMTPSFADYLLLDRSFSQALLPEFRKILFCGERLSARTVRKLKDRFEGIDIVNSYGPTECTFAVTAAHVATEDAVEASDHISDQRSDQTSDQRSDRTSDQIADRTSDQIADSQNALLTVGVVKEDTQIFILGEQNDEILIVGKSVAAGYVDGSGENSFVSFHGKRAYRTGDRGYLRGQELFVTGRMDDQIKYKGYRIELADIENNLRQLDCVEEAAVAVERGRDDAVKRIYAFVVPGADPGSQNNDVTPDSERLKEDRIRIELLQRVPEYMCPQIRIVTQIPLTQNGKCDRARLLEMELGKEQ